MGLNAPAQNSRKFYAVTKSDSINLPGSPVGFYVGGAGDVALVGYDDAAGRFLIENSYGPGFADGGFFGLPYEDLLKVSAECWSVDRVEGFQIKPVEGYVSIPFYLPPADFVQHYVGNRPLYKAEIDRLAATEGVQAIINFAREHHINDRMLENMYHQPRGTLRQSYEASKDQFDWSGFLWADM